MEEKKIYCERVSQYQTVRVVKNPFSGLTFPMRLGNEVIWRNFSPLCLAFTRFWLQHFKGFHALAVGKTKQITCTNKAMHFFYVSQTRETKMQMLICRVCLLGPQTCFLCKSPMAPPGGGGDGLLKSTLGNKHIYFAKVRQGQ